MSRYLIISSDCHAGLPTVEYRDYLDPQYRDAFDESVKRAEAARAAMGGGMGIMDPEFARQWEEENEEGLRGGWDAAHRDKELDADGVAGEILFPVSDAVAGSTSAPFGAGLSMSADVEPELMLAGARAHNRWLAELCAVAPERRGGVALAPILHDPQSAVAEIEWARDNGLRGGILIPSLWGSTRRTTTSATTRCGPRAKTSTCPCTRTRARPAASTATTSGSTPRRPRGGRPARSGSSSGRACSSATRS